MVFRFTSVHRLYSPHRLQKTPLKLHSSIQNSWEELSRSSNPNSSFAPSNTQNATLWHTAPSLCSEMSIAALNPFPSWKHILPRHNPDNKFLLFTPWKYFSYPEPRNWNAFKTNVPVFKLRSSKYTPPPREQLRQLSFKRKHLFWFEHSI